MSLLTRTGNDRVSVYTFERGANGGSKRFAAEEQLPHNLPSASQREQRRRDTEPTRTSFLPPSPAYGGAAAGLDYSHRLKYFSEAGAKRCRRDYDSQSFQEGLVPVDRRAHATFKIMAGSYRRWIDFVRLSKRAREAQLQLQEKMVRAAELRQWQLLQRAFYGWRGLHQQEQEDGQRKMWQAVSHWSTASLQCSFFRCVCVCARHNVRIFL